MVENDPCYYWKVLDTFTTSQLIEVIEDLCQALDDEHMGCDSWYFQRAVQKIIDRGNANE